MFLAQQTSVKFLNKILKAYLRYIFVDERFLLCLAMDTIGLV